MFNIILYMLPYVTKGDNWYFYYLFYSTSIVGYLPVRWHSAFSHWYPQNGVLSGGSVLPPAQWILFPFTGL